jgi:DICT domain-containing protein/predicted DNA-binding transcriptional regulator AlpA
VNTRLSTLLRFRIEGVTQEIPTGQRAQRLLTIGELAARTGLSPAVVRTWEIRHGFPVPQRIGGGHRRYLESDVELVQRVQHRQRAGVRLEAAIREITSTAGTRSLSVFAMLRDEHPEVAPQLLHKATLLGLSRAIEDDYLASAESGLLCASFQRQRFYEASAARWWELARRSRWSVVFADFAAAREQTPDAPAQVPLLPDAPMLREWAVVAETPRLAVCLAGWEPPGQERAADRGRVFEVVWTLDPVVTRRALRICAEAAATAGLASAHETLWALDENPVVGRADPVRASALFNRAMGYVDRSLLR